MSYTLTLTDDTDSFSFTTLHVPITDNITEGLSDNTTLDGNIYTDFMYIKRTYGESFKWLTAEQYAKLMGFYERQFTEAKYPLLTISEMGVNNVPVRLSVTDGGIVDNCGTRENVKLKMRETVQL